MLFQIAKDALKAQVDFIARRDEIARSEVYPSLRAHLQRMNSEWFSGEPPAIDYDDPYCRAAYVYAHVPANANLCLAALRAEGVVQTASAAGSLHLVAFGGGPGTELLALAKLFAEAREDDDDFEQVDVQVDIIDKTNEWSESINAMKAAIRTEYSARFGKRKNWPAIIETNFTRLNFLAARNFANMSSLFQSDYVILNYVVSELGTKVDKLRDVLETVCQSDPAPNGVLIIDRADPATKRAARRLLDDLGMRVSSVSAMNGSMDRDEDKAEYGKLLERVGRKPRVTFNAFRLTAQQRSESRRLSGR